MMDDRGSKPSSKAVLKLVTNGAPFFEKNGFTAVLSAVLEHLRMHFPVI